MAALPAEELSELMMEIANARIKWMTRCLIEWLLHTMICGSKRRPPYGQISLRQMHLDHPSKANEKAPPAINPAER